MISVARTRWTALCISLLLSAPNEAAEGARSLAILAPASYLPGIPVLVRVEVRNTGGTLARDVWDAEAVLRPSPAGVTLSPDRVTLRNGRGSALVRVVPTAANQEVTVIAEIGSLQAQKVLRSLEGQAETKVQGTLADALTEWSGLVHVTGALTVPAGKTLRILPGALVLVDGASTSGAGYSIDIKGTLESLGTEAEPVTITAMDPARPWGEIHHDGAAPSTYRHTIVTRAGNSPGAGHTGTGPAIRPDGSTIVFEDCTISDTKGKTMQAGGSDLTFRRCLLARSVMGPEIQGTALLFEDCHSMEMPGTDDNDGLYIHGQQQGQSCTVRGAVFCFCDDDGIDTLGSDVTIDDCIVRDFLGKDLDAKAISILNGEVTVRGCLLVDNGVGISAKGQYDTSVVKVHVENCTIHAGVPEAQVGIQTDDKYGVPKARVYYFVKDSIIRAPTAVRTDYPQFPDDIQIAYSDLSMSWTGEGNITEDPLFADPAGFDFLLGTGSPCIDAGDPASPQDPDGTRADMGAFPFQHLVDGSFVRGLVNDDPDVDVSDVVTILLYLFAGRSISCQDAADANDDGLLNLSDCIYLLDYLFRAGAPIDAPTGACDSDPTPDDLDCRAFVCP
jgi:hypothetical protein